MSEDSADRSAIIKISRTHAYGKVEISWILKKSANLAINSTEYEDNVKYMSSQFLKSSGKVVCGTGKLECNAKISIIDDKVCIINFCRFSQFVV